MAHLATRHKEGARAALAALGLGFSQPSLGSVGIKAPTTAPGLPNPAKLPSIPKMSTTPTSSTGSVGTDAAKVAFNVGMGASTSSDGAGSRRSEPADTSRRQRSLIDRAFQDNDDAFATSSMPLPGNVSP